MMGWFVAILLLVLMGMSGYYFAGVRLGFAHQSVIVFGMLCSSVFGWFFLLPGHSNYVARLPEPLSGLVQSAVWCASIWIPAALVGWLVGWATRIRKRDDSPPE
jgi:hypothetical protein